METQSQTLNETLSWNERIWKQLTSNEKHLNSALFFGKRGLGKTHLAIQYAIKFMDDMGNNDVFVGANHPDMHVLMPEDEALGLIEDDTLLNAENIAFSAQKLLAQYSMRYLENNKNKAKKIISISQVRQLIDQVMQHPHKAKHKIVIIKSSDKMNESSANALLKTLEEPPENTIFILISDQVERLPITIRSRCTQFYFRSPDKEIGIQWLSKKGLEQHAESYLMMANRAPLNALRLSEQNEIDNLRNIFTSINNLWRKQTSAIELAKLWHGYDFKDISNHLSRFLVDLLKIKSVTNDKIESIELFYPVQREWSVKIARSIDMALLCETIDHISSIKTLSDSSVDKLLLLEGAAINFERLSA